ncbi:MAG: hypothetical protein ABFS56_02525 [Pseudomonadota bacterium]
MDHPNKSAGYENKTKEKRELIRVYQVKPKSLEKLADMLDTDEPIKRDPPVEPVKRDLPVDQPAPKHQSVPADDGFENQPKQIVHKVRPDDLGKAMADILNEYKRTSAFLMAGELNTTVENVIKVADGLPNVQIIPNNWNKYTIALRLIE